MAVDLEAIGKRMEEVAGQAIPYPLRDTICALLDEDIPAMIAEIESLRSDLAAARAEIAESRESIRAKEYTVSQFVPLSGVLTNSEDMPLATAMYLVAPVRDFKP